MGSHFVHIKVQSILRYSKNSTQWDPISFTSLNVNEMGSHSVLFLL